MEKDTDIDALARMVAEGFSSMNQKFDEGFSNVNERFDSLEGRFDSLEQTVQDINRRIDTVIVPALDTSAHRIKKLEEHLA